MAAPETIQVFVPLKLRKKNGRPKILPPADYRASDDKRQDPHILRAIGRAWGVAAADGSGRLRYDPGTGRGRRSGRASCQQAATIGLSGTRSAETVDLWAGGVRGQLV